jgi:hypothetical protein
LSQLPDFDYIRTKIPITAVARQLGLHVNGYRARCWRPDQHRNGDADPSVRFHKATNRGRCFVCDPHALSNIDLVMAVRGCGLRSAIQWITALFTVPLRAKGSHIGTREEWFPRFRAGDVGTVVETLVRSGIWSTLSHAERSILPVLSAYVGRDNGPVAISYQGLMQFSGVGSSATIAAALRRFEQMRFLQVFRERSTGPLRRVNHYAFTFDDPEFQALVTRVFQLQRAEIELEKELRAEERRARSKS